MSLPCVCIVCRNPVVWGGKSWREAGNRGARHTCPSDRPTCENVEDFAQTNPDNGAVEASNTEVHP